MRHELLERFADVVLGRELTMEPVAVERLAERLWASTIELGPIAVRLHPDDVALLATRLPTREDPTLERGDLVLEIRDGEIDARYAVRLADVIVSVTS